MNKLLSMADATLFPRTPEVAEQSKNLYDALDLAGINRQTLTENGIDEAIGAFESACNSSGYVVGFRAAMDIARECWGNCNREGGGV